MIRATRLLKTTKNFFLVCPAIQKHQLSEDNFIYSLECRELYLDGNSLECEGVIELIKLFADHAEMEAIERAEKKDDVTLSPTSESMLGLPSSMMSSGSRPTSSLSVRSKTDR